VTTEETAQGSLPSYTLSHPRRH